jgi:hypothetical protein
MSGLTSPSHDSPPFPTRGLARYSSLPLKTLRTYLTHPEHPLPHYRLPGKILVHVDDFDLWVGHFKHGEPTAPSHDVDQLVNSAMHGLQLPRGKE